MHIQQNTELLNSSDLCEANVHVNSDIMGEENSFADDDSNIREKPELLANGDHVEVQVQQNTEEVVQDSDPQEGDIFCVCVLVFNNFFCRKKCLINVDNNIYLCLLPGLYLSQR